MIKEFLDQKPLEKLSQMLKKHYDTAPIIIIDEYDTPIQEGYSKDFYKEAELKD